MAAGTGLPEGGEIPGTVKHQNMDIIIIADIVSSLIDEVECGEIEKRMLQLSSFQQEDCNSVDVNAPYSTTGCGSPGVPTGSSLEQWQEASKAPEKDDGSSASSVYCEKCCISFPTFMQWDSHSSVLHPSESKRMDHNSNINIHYQCTICRGHFNGVHSFLLHESCEDKAKRRLSLTDYCVCPFCGCGLPRSQARPHLTSSHSTELDGIKGVGACHLCRPFSKISSCTELVCHLISWHALVVRMTLSSGESASSKPVSQEDATKDVSDGGLGSRELCHLCGKNIPSREFDHHVVVVHCSPESDKKPLKRSTSSAMSTTVKKRKTSLCDMEESQGRKEPRAKKSISKKDKPSRVGSPAGVSVRHCMSCKEEFPSCASLALHRTEQKCEPNRVVHCGVCNSIFMNWQLLTHLLSHEKELSLESIPADERRNRLAMLVCGYAGYCEDCVAFATEPDHSCKDMAKESRLRCTMCTKIFLNRYLVASHQTLFHNKQEAILCYDVFGRKKKATPQNGGSSGDGGREVMVDPRHRALTRKKVAEMMSGGEPSPQDLGCKFCNATFHGRMMRDLHVEKLHGRRCQDWLHQAWMRVSNQSGDGEKEGRNGESWHVPSFEELKSFLQYEHSIQTAAVEKRREAQKDMQEQSEMKRPRESVSESGTSRSWRQGNTLVPSENVVQVGRTPGPRTPRQGPIEKSVRTGLPKRGAAGEAKLLVPSKPYNRGTLGLAWAKLPFNFKNVPEELREKRPVITRLATTGDSPASGHGRYEAAFPCRPGGSSSTSRSTTVYPGSTVRHVGDVSIGPGGGNRVYLQKASPTPPVSQTAKTRMGGGDMGRRVYTVQPATDPLFLRPSAPVSRNPAPRPRIFGNGRPGSGIPIPPPRLPGTPLGAGIRSGKIPLSSIRMYKPRDGTHIQGVPPMVNHPSVVQHQPVQPATDPLFLRPSAPVSRNPAPRPRIFGNGRPGSGIPIPPPRLPGTPLGAGIRSGKIPLSSIRMYKPRDGTHIQGVPPMVNHPSVVQHQPKIVPGNHPKPPMNVRIVRLPTVSPSVRAAGTRNPGNISSLQRAERIRRNKQPIEVIEFDDDSDDDIEFIEHRSN